MEQTTTGIMPIEKQYLTVGVVCLLLGTAVGFGIKAGVSMSALDTLKDAATKRDEQYRHDQDLQHFDMRAIVDDVATLKGIVKYQSREIDDLKAEEEDREGRRR